MIKSLAGFIILILAWGHIEAASLLLKSEVRLAEGFVRLSDLVLEDSADRFETIFLGQIKLGEEIKLHLTYIQKRLNRFGYLTLDPKTKSGLDFVLVRAVEKEVYLAEKAKVPKLVLPDRVVVVKDALSRGTVLRADMLEKQPLTENNQDAFREFDEVLGYELERNLSKGTPIKPRYISRPPLIKRGDAVRLIIKSHGVEISGIAKALEDGNLGETIEVRRQNESISAKILDEQTVLVQGP